MATSFVRPTLVKAGPVELHGSVCNINTPGTAESKWGGGEGRGHEFPG